MRKIAVYRFEVWHAPSSAWKKEPAYATRGHIEARGGAMVLNTKIEVEEDHLTPEGVVTQKVS